MRASRVKTIYCKLHPCRSKRFRTIIASRQIHISTVVYYLERKTLVDGLDTASYGLHERRCLSSATRRIVLLRLYNKNDGRPAGPIVFIPPGQPQMIRYVLVVRCHQMDLVGDSTQETHEVFHGFPPFAL